MTDDGGTDEMADDYGDAAAALAEKIADELGEGWTQLPGLEGTEKFFILHDDRVFLQAGRYLFGVLEGTKRLGVTIQANESRLDTGHFDEGEFVLDRVDSAGDAALN